MRDEFSTSDVYQDLQELNCSINEIVELPRGFGNFSSIRILDLSHNK